MLKTTNINNGNAHPVPGNYLTEPNDLSVGQVAAKADIVGDGSRGQSGAYDGCLAYGGINSCFNLYD
jgi:hypothetical protein